MKRIRYIALLQFLIVCYSGARAQDDFNPDSPPEPEQPAIRLDLCVSPSEAGSVSGGGRYAPGKKVNITSYGNAGFQFVKWTNADGEIVSTSQSFTYTKSEKNETLTANFVFNPDAPADPAEQQTIMYYKLSLASTVGGRVSGGGSYQPNSQVLLRANCDEGYYFSGWYDPEGNCLSTNTSFYYTTIDRHVIITGHFTFDPESPVEPTPSTLKPKHSLWATCTEGGSVSWSNKRLQEGENVTMTAYVNEGYIFLGWYLNGELYTNLREFSYTVGTEDNQNFEARFEFNPDSPSDPLVPTTTKHGFFLMNKVTTPGTIVQFPIYMSNVRIIGDMTFQLTFPKELSPNLESVGMSAKAIGYSISCNALNDTTYVMSFIGGETPVGNTAVIIFTVPVSENIQTGKGYPIKINQVSVAETDGTTVAAATRNGRISVYKSGDANGDDRVDLTDAVMIVFHSLGMAQKGLIEIAADTNTDENVDLTDAVTVVYKSLGVVNEPVQIDPE